MLSRERPFVPVALGWVLVGVMLYAWRCEFEPVRVTGLSMHPALHVGDVVLARRGERPGVGEIALIRSRGHGPVLHRAVSRRQGGIVTRGDANPFPDTELVAPQDATRVALVVPVGRLLEWWRQRVPCATLSAQSDSARR